MKMDRKTIKRKIDEILKYRPLGETLRRIGGKLLLTLPLVFCALALYWLSQKSKSYEEGWYSFAEAKKKLPDVMVPFPNRVIEKLKQRMATTRQFKRDEIEKLVEEALSNSKDGKVDQELKSVVDTIVGSILFQVFSDPENVIITINDKIKEGIGNEIIIHSKNKELKKDSNETDRKEEEAKKKKEKEVKKEIDKKLSGKEILSLEKIAESVPMIEQVTHELLESDKMRNNTHYRIEARTIDSLKNETLLFPGDALAALKNCDKREERSDDRSKEKFLGCLEKHSRNTLLASFDHDQRLRIFARIIELSRKDNPTDENDRSRKFLKAVFTPGGYAHLLYHFLCLLFAFGIFIAFVYLVAEIAKPYRSASNAPGKDTPATSSSENPVESAEKVTRELPGETIKSLFGGGKTAALATAATMALGTLALAVTVIVADKMDAAAINRLGNVTSYPTTNTNRTSSANILAETPPETVNNNQELRDLIASLESVLMNEITTNRNLIATNRDFVQKTTSELNGQTTALKNQFGELSKQTDKLGRFADLDRLFAQGEMRRLQLQQTQIHQAMLSLQAQHGADFNRMLGSTERAMVSANGALTSVLSGVNDTNKKVGDTGAKLEKGDSDKSALSLALMRRGFLVRLAHFIRGVRVYKLPKYNACPSGWDLSPPDCDKLLKDLRDKPYVNKKDLERELETRGIPKTTRDKILSEL